MFYIADITHYNEYDEAEKTSHAIVWADSYADAARKVDSDWSESLISMSLQEIGDGWEEDDPTFYISESVADAFKHELMEEVYCYKSEWRRDREAKENEKLIAKLKMEAD